MHLKTLKIIATSGFLTALQCTKFVFGRGSAPDPARYILPRTGEVFVFGRLFLPRDATPSCGVCPSVTFVDHVKTSEHIFEIFSPSSSHIILVFPHQTGWRYSDGTPLTGASNRMQMGYRHKSRFWSNSWLSKVAGRAKCQKHPKFRNA